MARLFIAAWPDDELAAQLTALHRPDAEGVRWSPPSNWHITLRFLGEVPVEAVADRLTAADLPAATATLGPTIERLGPQVVMIPVAGADRLAEAVRTATAGLGEPEQFGFRGHLTLARTRRGAPSSLLGTRFDATARIDRISLVASRLDPAGSIYETIDTYPLR